jgi:hypothetical protein
VPYVGVQYAAIPEFQGIGTSASTVDAAPRNRPPNAK